MARYDSSLPLTVLDLQSTKSSILWELRSLGDRAAERLRAHLANTERGIFLTSDQPSARAAHSLRPPAGGESRIGHRGSMGGTGTDRGATATCGRPIGQKAPLVDRHALETLFRHHITHDAQMLSRWQQELERRLEAHTPTPGSTRRHTGTGEGTSPASTCPTSPLRYKQHLGEHSRFRSPASASASATPDDAGSCGSAAQAEPGGVRPTPTTHPVGIQDRLLSSSHGGHGGGEHSSGAAPPLGWMSGTQPWPLTAAHGYPAASSTIPPPVAERLSHPGPPRHAPQGVMDPSGGGGLDSGAGVDHEAAGKGERTEVGGPDILPTAALRAGHRDAVAVAAATGGACGGAGGAWEWEEPSASPRRELPDQLVALIKHQHILALMDACGNGRKHSSMSYSPNAGDGAAATAAAAVTAAGLPARRAQYAPAPMPASLSSAPPPALHAPAGHAAATAASTGSGSAAATATTSSGTTSPNDSISATASTQTPWRFTASSPMSSGSVGPSRSPSGRQPV